MYSSNVLMSKREIQFWPTALAMEVACIESVNAFSSLLTLCAILTKIYPLHLCDIIREFIAACVFFVRLFFFIFSLF